MLRSLIAFPLVALAACSAENRDPESNVVDVNAAAARAEGDIANYAAGMPRPVAFPAVTGQAVPSPRRSLPESAAEPGSRQAAGAIVQRYYAFIEAGRYLDARALWRDPGKPQGMSAVDFAASFDRYAGYHAEVGAPGDVDAGAGQRYVTVPVRIHGTLKEDGRPFALVGDVIVRHVAGGIETPDAGDHAWRIDRIDVKPAQAANDAAAPPGRGDVP